MSKTNPTPKSDIRSRFALTEPQITALAALVEGETVTAAAKRAGVSRQTVSEWKNRNASFIAAFNGLTSDQISQVHGQLVRLAPQAVETLSRELSSGGDVAARAARDVLRLVQRLGSSVIGSADPIVVEKEIAAAADEALWSKLCQLRDQDDTG